MGAPPPPSAPTLLWQRTEQGHGRPALDDHSVYFLTRDHSVIALEAATGALRWRQTTGEPGEVTVGSAVVSAGPVVVAGDYNLVAFDRATGRRRWHFVPAVGHAPGIFLGGVAGGRVFAGSGAGRIYAVHTDSGELSWSALAAPTTDATVFAPVTDGRVVVAGYTVFSTPVTGGVAAFEVASGRPLWRTAFPPASDPLLGTGSTGGPVLAADVVAATRGDGQIFAFHRDTGVVRWTLPASTTFPEYLRGPIGVTPPSTSPDHRPLVVSGPALVAGSLKGDVVAYNLATRRELWRYRDPRLGSVSYALAADERSVFVPFGNGRHVALSAITGTELWRSGEGESFFWPAALDPSRVFLGGKGGVRAIRR